VYYAAENRSDNRFFSVVIPKDHFPTGIVAFTLLSDKGEPLNERIAFIGHQDRLKLKLNTDKQVYHTREKVKLELKATSGASGPSAGSFSVAVTDEDKVPIDSLNEQTIESYLLLTSELKGRIEQPNYYFLHPSDQSRSDLDNLLLTQGYRHFIWKQDTATYPAEQGMQISGTVKKNGRPVAGAKVKLFSNTGGMFMLDTLTDQEGRFAFKGLLFADSTKFVVQSRVKKGQDDVTL
jgi:hypothetical protein